MLRENENSYLDENKSFFSQIAKTLNLPILLIDNNLEIVCSSRKFNELLGFDCTNNSLKSVFNINPSFTNITQNYYSEKINGVIRLAPVLLNETLVGFIATFEKESETQITDSTKNSFRATVHDLNNIFTNIINSIDLLKSRDINQAHQEKLFGIIETNSNRAADIISTHIRKKNDPDSFKSHIDINTLLNEISTSFKLFLPDRISFTTNIQFGLPEVRGNYTELYRTFYNLLINAKEAIQGDGQIELHAFQMLPLSTEDEMTIPQKMICVRVIDTGIGIDETHLPLIFNSKFSTKEKETISGIGLSNVKKIVDKHRGKISVKSNPGKGSNFEIHLPIIEKSKNIIVDELKHLLIAEDEDTLRELLKDLFESHGYKVSAVSDGLGVINELKKNPYFDLLIIDKKMPNMDGVECIDLITKDNRSIPIILATGSAGEELEKLVEAYKSTTAIHKPYKFDDLLDLVRSVIS